MEELDGLVEPRALDACSGVAQIGLVQTMSLAASPANCFLMIILNIELAMFLLKGNLDIIFSVYSSQLNVHFGLAEQQSSMVQYMKLAV